MTLRPHANCTAPHIRLTLTDECVERYSSFRRTHLGHPVDLLANGKPLLEGLVSTNASSQMTVFIFTSVDEARALVDSLNTK